MVKEKLVWPREINHGYSIMHVQNGFALLGRRFGYLTGHAEPLPTKCLKGCWQLCIMQFLLFSWILILLLALHKYISLIYGLLV